MDKDVVFRKDERIFASISDIFKHIVNPKNSVNVMLLVLAGLSYDMFF